MEIKFLLTDIDGNPLGTATYPLYVSGDTYPIDSTLVDDGGTPVGTDESPLYVEVD